MERAGESGRLQERVGGCRREWKVAREYKVAGESGRLKERVEGYRREWKVAEECKVAGENWRCIRLKSRQRILKHHIILA